VEMWPELVSVPMARSPSQMIAALRESGALKMCCQRSLACSEFPGSAANSESMDLGHHLLDALAEAARCNAPLEVRIVRLNVDKTDLPREHPPFQSQCQSGTRRRRCFASGSRSRAARSRSFSVHRESKVP
jgi:hypothetical protein